MHRPVLWVLTTTFPRWEGDVQPPFVHELSRRLVDRFRVIVLAPRAPGAADEEIMSGMLVIRYAYCWRRFETLAYGSGVLGNLKGKPWRLLLVPLLLAGLWRAMRRLSHVSPADVVHAHWLFPQAWVATLVHGRSGPPLIATCHGADVFALRGRFWALMRRRVLRSAQAVTVVSATMKAALQPTSGEAERLHVIPMGVDLRSLFKPSDAAGERRDGLLFVGRLVPKKGCDILLRALSHLGSRGLRPKLLIVGDGPERTMLERLAQEIGLAGQVTFEGAVLNSELPELFRRSAAAVLPFTVANDGDREGLGLVAVEAMGCGCPLVSTPLAEINDVVRNGVTAWIAKSSDSIALADAIEAVLADPDAAQERALQARTDAISRFDWPAIADQYGDLMEHVLKPVPVEAARTGPGSSAPVKG